ncbi:competence type IV pilus minor pilin ComGD [Thalassobacillus hwangdonensis]|uniref:Competence type IV pilus minor pilin ComGD n=1 Tax=Thalassobacillus hwangdonensis TaxID=546108 RepID=A0ABW3L136_9BACI
MLRPPERNGFTLLETMLVLFIMVIFLSIATPIHFSTKEQQETKLFLDQFRQDVLLLQKLSMIGPSRYHMIVAPSSLHYFIYNESDKKLVLLRNFPPRWSIDMMNMKSAIKFSTKGTIRTPRTFFIETTSRKYKVVFPFGKSRCYISEI